MYPAQTTIRHDKNGQAKGIILAKKKKTYSTRRPKNSYSLPKHHRNMLGLRFFLELANGAQKKKSDVIIRKLPQPNSYSTATSKECEAKTRKRGQKRLVLRWHVQTTLIEQTIWSG